MTKAIPPDKVAKYLDAYPGDMICALQVWYEGLGGQGVPDLERMAQINAALSNAPGWRGAGDVRYEKFGIQRSYKRN